ncbi:MAG: DEAD/DEAH box helicase, partial [Gammaproteobacteria bacterium]|nr:DEAD/DEAH box helicase [Gammaproteobacteria bacterium]
YIGESSDESILSNLGSDQWIKICKKTKDQAHDVAAELLDIYAKRSLVLGKSQVVDSNDYAKFCEGFEYVLTRDQSKVIEQVLDDLASSKSMDRLICGDVGFGKTEVAMRAAFTTAINGYQVVILVPTTILAQQHYETFTERFSNWPININLMTRTQTKKSKDLLTENIKNGRADIIIGTHGVLSENIKYKDLRLVIVDEEHRFGVRQKEKLKKIKENIDYLALTATPIPRTLNMAIGDLKDISMITTPPESRMPVKTYLSQWENSLVREACQREINRGGQILFVHNRIEDINNVAENIRKIIPTISIGIAHGQMKEKALEIIMMQFYSNQFDLLLATSIIESGLDIPNANTIIINQADRFGLAQLHQLRGRVGRSERQSYAYLLIPPKHKLTPQGEKRLQAIEAIEDLGVGFILATHDLEIRGAGEILGDEQSGQIQKIGFTLYKDILEQTIKTMRSDGSNQVIENFSTDINLNIPALINEEYMPDVHLRLTMYKRISSTFKNKDLNKIKSELMDRFGNLPEYTENLILLTKLRNNAKNLGIEKIRLNKTHGRIYFNSASNIDTQLLINLIHNDTNYKLYPDQSLGFSGEFINTEDRINKVKYLLNYLANH